MRHGPYAADAPCPRCHEFAGCVLTDGNLTGCKNNGAVPGWERVADWAFGSGLYKRAGKPPNEDSPILSVRRFSEMTPRPITWLWPDRIPYGKLTIFCGAPEQFKTGILLDIAARKSAGRSWPDTRDQPNAPGGVAILSGEDDSTDTLLPRLMVAGADLSRIVEIEGVRQPQSEEIDPLYIDEHFHRFDEFLAANDISLVFIDPLGAFLSRKADTHKDSEVRVVTARLAKLAENHKVAIVAIMHTNKSYGGTTLKRISGSGAFGASARCVWFFGQDPDDPTRNLMLSAKMNIGPRPQGLAYAIGIQDLPEIGSQPIALWFDEAVSKTADDVLRAETERPGKIDEAVVVIQDALAAGPIKSAELDRLRDEAGISAPTFKRARARLRVKTDKSKGRKHGDWTVSLPTVSTTNNDTLETVDPLERLDGSRVSRGSRGSTVPCADDEPVGTGWHPEPGDGRTEWARR